MKIRFVALFAAFTCLAIPARTVSADQKPVLPAAASQVVSEKDVLGNWQTQGEGWRARLNADHSAAVYFEGVFESKPFFTTWKLTGNHVIFSDASSFKVGNIVDLGSDFVLIPYKNQFVMLSKRELPIAEKRGFLAAECFWHTPQKTTAGNIRNRKTDA